MKKSFFQKTYNINIKLILFIILSFLTTFVCQLVPKLLGTYDILASNAPVIFVEKKINLIAQFSHNLNITLCLILIALLTFESIQRLLTDSILNYYKSIYQTIRLRQFLNQEESSEPIITMENQTVNHSNPIYNHFNSAARKCNVDVRKKTVTVFLKIPKTQQSQKLLKDMEENIKEEISSRNPNYYFSSPNRERNTLWFTGNKR